MQYNLYLMPQGVSQPGNNQGNVVLQFLSYTVQPQNNGQPVDMANGKNRESETSVYIKWSAIEGRFNTEQEIRNEIRRVCDEVIHDHGKLPIREYPKVNFPKRQSEENPERKKKFLFVDFENGDPSLGKDMSREFIKRFNLTYGQNIAQCAKEKDQEENNIYFVPLPRWFKENNLLEKILESLDKVGYKPTSDPQKWSIRVQQPTEQRPGDQFPIGFCRIENDPETLTQIKACMNQKNWEDLNFDTGDLVNRHRKLTVKNANRNTKTVETAPTILSGRHNLLPPTPSYVLPNMPYQDFSPSPAPLSAQPSTNHMFEQMVQPKYQPPTPLTYRPFDSPSTSGVSSRFNPHEPQPHYNLPTSPMPFQSPTNYNYYKF